MDRLVDLIHVYDDILSEKDCSFLIDYFELNTSKHERFDNDGAPNFTQLNLTNCKTENLRVENLHKQLLDTIFEYTEKYYEYVDKRVFPKTCLLENFRIKKYKSNGIDRFDTHVDVSDKPSSNRYLSITFYLNDVEKGGNTVFKDKSIQPKRGRMLLFPPMWMYPHKGEPPISNTKYILTTYFHYN